MNMRNAWKVRVAGCLPGSRVRTARELSGAPRLDDRTGHTARETLLAEARDHLANLVDARPSEPGRDRLAACRVHAHVERAVGAEAEAAARIVELRRGHAEVEEHAPASTTFCV
jgi:hypothetical protein